MDEKSNNQRISRIVDSTGTPYRTLPGDLDEAAESWSEQIASISQSMRDYAFAHPALTHDEARVSIVSGKFSHLLNLSETVAIHALLYVAPSVEETDPLLFWLVAMSLISRASGRPKSVNLWTSRELKMIKKLELDFLNGVGESDAGAYQQTQAAMLCTKHFSEDEMTLIGRDGL